MKLDSDHNSISPEQLEECAPEIQKTEYHGDRSMPCSSFKIETAEGAKMHQFSNKSAPVQTNLDLLIPAECKNQKPPGGPDLQCALLRIFVCDISERINNLLMGIWGNVTLIRMQLADHHPGFQRVCDLETTIQNNVQVLQLIFGYLAERRTTAKKLRLRLISEKIFEKEQNSETIPLDRIWDQLKATESATSPACVAGILVYILDRFLKKIALECRVIAGFSKYSKKRAKKIELLMQRGSSIIKQLRLFAGELQPNTGRVRLNQLLRKQATEAQLEHQGLILELQLDPKLPQVWADRAQLKWMLQQVINNAVLTMHRDAKLDLCASSASHYYPSRHSDQIMPDSGVLITIKETPHKRISGPAATPERFSYTVMRGQYMGLSLAAAGSIARTHGGDLQVRSDSYGCRSCTIIWPAAQKIKEKKHVGKLVVSP